MHLVAGAEPHPQGKGTSMLKPCGGGLGQNAPLKGGDVCKIGDGPRKTKKHVEDLDYSKHFLKVHMHMWR